jgi:ATP-dependent DNA ligase
MERTKPPAKRPGMIEPCIPTRVSKPPVGPQGIHEIKHDGYRLIARKRDGRVRLFTRNGFDWIYPRISEAVAGLRTASLTIDGEAVWCDGEGLAIFDKLHSRAYDGEVILYAFDHLELDGQDWRPHTLEERKAKLAKLLAKAPAGIQYSEHLEGDGAAILAFACGLGCEGIVSKHREHPYRSGSSKSWLKTKNPQAPGVLRFRAVTGQPDYLAAALHFAGRAGRFLNDSERARFFEVARRYRTLAFAEGMRFTRDMPKRPAAASVRRRDKAEAGSALMTRA